eukprot:ANDGO_03472.mRNA.1 hypothetical protein
MTTVAGKSNFFSNLERLYLENILEDWRRKTSSVLSTGTCQTIRLEPSCARHPWFSMPCFPSVDEVVRTLPAFSTKSLQSAYLFVLQNIDIPFMEYVQALKVPSRFFLVRFKLPPALQTAYRNNQIVKDILSHPSTSKILFIRGESVEYPFEFRSAILPVLLEELSRIQKQATFAAFSRSMFSEAAKFMTHFADLMDSENKNQFRMAMEESLNFKDYNLSEAEKTMLDECIRLFNFCSDLAALPTTYVEAENRFLRIVWSPFLRRYDVMHTKLMLKFALRSVRVLVSQYLQIPRTAEDSRERAILEEQMNRIHCLIRLHRILLQKLELHLSGQNLQKPQECMLSVDPGDFLDPGNAERALVDGPTVCMDVFANSLQYQVKFRLPVCERYQSLLFPQSPASVMLQILFQAALTKNVPTGT